MICRGPFLFHLPDLVVYGCSGSFFDTPHLLIDNSLRIRLDLVVIALYLLHHDVVTVPVLEVVDDRDFLISLFFRADLGMVHDNFGMKYFLLYPLIKIIRHSPDKRAL